MRSLAPYPRHRERAKSQKRRVRRSANRSPLSALRSQPRSAFTLIEMLVSVALVLLMLLLFAQIFGTAVGSMREQQALAQNDQKARAIESVLRSDFAKMTFRQPRVRGVQGIVPLAFGWPIDAERQRGFFYLSENDLENPGDDVLHFTIDLRRTDRDPDVNVLRGRAATLGRPSGPPDDNGDGNPDDLLSPPHTDADRNQPDYDDGVYDNGVGESPAAEVVYFLRGGNLYRRVLMLRQPPTPTQYSIPGQPSFPPPPAEFAVQPGVGVNGATVIGGNLINRKFMQPGASGLVPSDYSSPSLDVFGLTPNTSDFLNDFDYSAWSWWKDIDSSNGPTAFPQDQYWLMFNGTDSLQNVPGATPFPIGNPFYRFGHRPRLDGFLPANPLKQLAGQPMEYLLDGTFNPLMFVGRFTHEETSNPSFGYPGVVPQDGTPITFNPMLDGFAVADTNGNSIVDLYEGGPRAGEDLILAGVESFDIEVWDAGFSEPSIPCDANSDGILQPAEYGFDVNGNNVIDVIDAKWVNLGHAGVIPAAGGLLRPGSFGNTQLQNRPYGPRIVTLGADGQPGIAGFDDNSDGTTDNAPELGWPGSDDISNRCFDTWHPSATTGFGVAPFQPVLIEPTIASAVNGGVLWSWTANAGNLNYWTILFPGIEDRNLNGMMDPGEDRNNNGILDSDTSYYYRPVKVLQDLNGNRLADGGGDDIYGQTGLREPEWPREPGATVVERADTNSDNIPDADGVIWQCFDNRIGLQMVRVTVRYKDPGKNLPRQVSIVHSFVE